MMEKIKKIALSLFGLMTFVFCVNLNVNAASTTANAKGITTDKLSYVADYTTENKTIQGSKYTYGKVKLWSSIYNYYHEETDTMYYVVFVQSFINGAGYNSDAGYFHASGMNVGVWAYGYGINEVAYRPIQGSSSYSVSYEANLSSTVGTDSGVSIGYSYGSTINVNDVNLVIDSDCSTMFSYLDFDYRFTAYDDGNVSERSPYIGQYFEISSVVFEIENYSQTLDYAVVFDIDYVGTIHRKNKKGKSDYDMAKEIRHMYSLKHGEIIQEEFVGKEYDI